MNRFDFTLRNNCIVPYPFPIHYITIAQYVFKIFILNSKLRDVNARCQTLSSFIDFSDVSNISKNIDELSVGKQDAPCVVIFFQEN